MTTTMEKILSGNNLTGVIQAEKDGLPTILPAGFYATSKRVSGNQMTYDRVDGNRQLAQIVQYGSPSKRRNLKGVSQKTVTGISAKEHQVYDPSIFNKLRAVGTDVKNNKGVQEITRQTSNFQFYFKNLRTTAIQSALLKGYIYVDADGNLLPSATGAAQTIDYGIPATNTGQLKQIDGSTAIFGTTWSGSPDLSKDHDVLHSTALQRCGYPLRYAVYGKNVKEYLQDYASSAGMLVGNPELQNTFRNGATTFQMFNLTWIPGYDGFFIDQNGTAQTILGDDQVVYMPEPDFTWYDLMEGSELIPSDFQMKANAADIANSLQEMNGMYSYATLVDDPVTIKQIAGDNFLPVIKVPKAIYIADIKF